MEEILRFEHVSYAYEEEREALLDVCVKVCAGERVAVLGSNGAGKSTFFLLANGVLRPGAGRILFRGAPVGSGAKQLNVLRRGVGLVFQDPEVQLLGGSVEFMLTALLLLNGIICALLPFILPAVVGQGGFEIYLNVAQNISLVMLLPLVLALAARRFYPRAIAWPRKLKDVTFGIWVVILVLIAANASYDISSRDGISERVLEQIGAVSLLVCGINFGLGHLLGGRTRAAECSQALGQKNTTLSIYLALTYASPIAALGPTFYVLWHNLWNAWQLYRASERKRRNG